jgi:hypothetical protein
MRESKNTETRERDTEWEGEGVGQYICCRTEEEEAWNNYSQEYPSLWFELAPTPPPPHTHTNTLRATISTSHTERKSLRKMEGR